MLGLPVWLWVLIALVLLLVAIVRSYYTRFRGMCRQVREELSELVRRERPGVEVVGERQGDLVLRMEDGGERVWEMADVYAAVARLPGLGREPEARAAVYRQALADFFQPGLEELAGPLTLATHGNRIRPQLVRPDFLDRFPADAGVIRTPVPGLDLSEVYLLGPTAAARCVTDGDCRALGLDPAALRERALANLRTNFPRELVAGALDGGGGTAIQFGDGFDAARLLLVPEHLPEDGELVALIPHQDLLALLHASVLRDPEQLAEALRGFDCDHPPLLDRPVRVTRSGFQAV